MGKRRPCLAGGASRAVGTRAPSGAGRHPEQLTSHDAERGGGAKGGQTRRSLPLCIASTKCDIEDQGLSNGPFWQVAEESHSVGRPGAGRKVGFTIAEVCTYSQQEAVDEMDTAMSRLHFLAPGSQAAEAEGADGIFENPAAQKIDASRTSFSLHGEWQRTEAKQAEKGQSCPAGHDLKPQSQTAQGQRRRSSYNPNHLNFLDCGREQIRSPFRHNDAVVDIHSTCDSEKGSVPGFTKAGASSLKSSNCQYSPQGTCRESTVGPNPALVSEAIPRSALCLAALIDQRLQMRPIAFELSTICNGLSDKLPVASLQAAVEPGVEQRHVSDKDSFSFGQLKEASDFLTTSWGDRLRSLSLECFEVSGLHPHPVMALQIAPTADDVKARSMIKVGYHLFVDGSALIPEDDEDDDGNVDLKEGVLRAGWAVVVLSEWVSASGEVEFVPEGFMSDPVKMEGSDAWLGATAEDSLQAEACAIAWATLWVLQNNPGQAVNEEGCDLLQYHIHFDNMTAGKGAAGLQKWNSTPEVKSVCRGLMQVAEVFKNVALVHCKAHVGQPFNELVDGLAKRAAKGKGSGSLPSPLPMPKVPPQQYVPWIWFSKRRDIQPGQWPEAGEGMQMPEVDTNFKDTNLEPCVKTKTVSANANVHVKLVCATLNVQTLELGKGKEKKGRDGMQVSGRVELLDEQMSDLGVNVLGLQETRSCREGKRAHKNYLAVYSKATATGMYGCSLWIAKTLQLSNGKEINVQLDQIVVKQTSPRMLTAVLAVPGVRLEFCVGHVPHVVSEDDSGAKAWWREYINTKGDAANVMLLDANAKLGSLLSESVGDHQAERECKGGEEMHKRMEETNMCVPATFADCHQGEGKTWRSTRGYMDRKDFVVVPKTWRSRSKTRVEYGVEWLQENDDHFPSLLEIDLEILKTAPAIARRCTGYDKPCLRIRKRRRRF